MNKENAYQYLPLVQALADGKTIQFNYGNAWIDAASNADFKWLESPDHYRIKPEPRTFQLWINRDSGSIRSHPQADKPEWERITVREVLE